MSAKRPREVVMRDYSFTTPSRSAPVVFRATSLFNAKTEFMSQFGYYPEGETTNAGEPNSEADATQAKSTE